MSRKDLACFLGCHRLGEVAVCHVVPDVANLVTAGGHGGPDDAFLFELVDLPMRRPLVMPLALARFFSGPNRSLVKKAPSPPPLGPPHSCWSVAV
jgi:hypothetical protein